MPFVARTRIERKYVRIPSGPWETGESGLILDFVPQFVPHCDKRKIPVPMNSERGLFCFSLESSATLDVASSFFVARAIARWQSCIHHARSCLTNHRSVQPSRRLELRPRWVDFAFCRPAKARKRIEILLVDLLASHEISKKRNGKVNKSV